MALTFGFYSDPALTTPAPAVLAVPQSRLAPPPADMCLWFGSPEAARICKSQAGTGTAPIVVSVVNATPGSNAPVGNVRLALTAAGLDSATPGAALSLPTEVLGGADNALPVHIRVQTSLTTTGRRANLSLATQMLVES